MRRLDDPSAGDVSREVEKLLLCLLLTAVNALSCLTAAIANRAAMASLRPALEMHCPGTDGCEV
jgi:hypothetical protein